MAIAFGTSTTAVGNDVATSSISVPSGVANDDMLLLVINVSESVGVTPTVSGSWTQKLRLDQVASGSNEDHVQILYWRRASSEPGSYTITWDGTYGNYGAAAMLRYTGVIKTGDPFRTTNTTFYDLGAGPKASAALTGVQATDMAIHMLGAAKSSWNTDAYDLAGPGGSWVERGEIYMTTASTGKPGHIAVEQLGTGTAPSFTSSGTGATNISWILFGTALMQEPPVPPLGSKIYTSASVRRASTW